MPGMVLDVPVWDYRRETLREQLNGIVRAQVCVVGLPPLRRDPQPVASAAAGSPAGGILNVVVEADDSQRIVPD
jgi:hypothetical protein